MARNRDPYRAARLGSAAALCLLVAALALACAPQRQYAAALVLADLAAGDGPSRLKRGTATPSRSSIGYTVGGRTHTGDLYLPGAREPEAGLVLVPGAVADGKDNPALVRFARTLARAGFAVLAPQLGGYGEIRIQPGHVRDVADAFVYVSAQNALAPAGRAGIAGFSYGVGPAVLAALDPALRGRVRFILGVGGYFDLRETIRFVTTGYFERDGASPYLAPSEYGKLVLANSLMSLLSSPADRVALGEMIGARRADPGADLTALAQRLGPEGWAVYRLLENTDPAATPRLIAALPARVADQLDALTLAGKPLELLAARLVLVHGRDDRLIPFPQSEALARAAAPGLARVFVLNRVLGHVDLTVAGLLSRQFWSEQLPDLWRLHRAVDLLLRERDAGPARGRPAR